VWGEARREKKSQTTVHRRLQLELRSRREQRRARIFVRSRECLMNKSFSLQTDSLFVYAMNPPSLLFLIPGEVKICVTRCAVCSPLGAGLEPAFDSTFFSPPRLFRCLLSSHIHFKLISVILRSRSSHVALVYRKQVL
jgi:hypothetical protein